jgi:hypothetical protein
MSLTTSQAHPEYHSRTFLNVIPDLGVSGLRPRDVGLRRRWHRDYRSDSHFTTGEHNSWDFYCDFNGPAAYPSSGCWGRSPALSKAINPGGRRRRKTRITKSSDRRQVISAAKVGKRLPLTTATMNSRLLFLRRFTQGRHVAEATRTAQKSRFGTLLWGVGFTASLTTAYTVGSLYPPDLATFVSPRPTPPIPLLGTPEAKAYATALEDLLQNLPLLKELRSREDKEDWYESRPYTEIPEEVRMNNLTAGSLSGPGKLALRPLVRVKHDESEAWGFIHLGRSLCGHDGIIHGGLMATLLDESMGRVVSTSDMSGASAYPCTGVL